MKQTLILWLPMAFCAGVSAIALFGSIGSPGWWQPAFFCFLPMCFYFVGAAMSQLQQEIRELQKQVAQLQGKDGEQHAAAISGKADDGQRFQFSLRWLFLLVLLVAIAAALIAKILSLS